MAKAKAKRQRWSVANVLSACVCKVFTAEYIVWDVIALDTETTLQTESPEAADDDKQTTLAENAAVNPQHSLPEEMVNFCGFPS